MVFFGKFYPSMPLRLFFLQHEVAFWGLQPLRWDVIAHDVHADCFDLASQLQIVPRFT